MTKSFGELDASVQATIDADADFQSSIEGLPDEEKDQAIQDRKRELYDKEIAQIADKAEKNEELAKNYKTRAEKAEQEAKSKKPAGGGEQPDKKPTLTIKDQILIAKADIHPDDIEEVIEFAETKNLPIGEALQNAKLKAILAVNAEFRKSAEVANTGTQRRVTAKVTPEKLVQELSEGKVPKPGTPEAEDVFWARRGGRRQ